MLSEWHQRNLVSAPIAARYEAQQQSALLPWRYVNINSIRHADMRSMRTRGRARAATVRKCAGTAFVAQLIAVSQSGR